MPDPPNRRINWPRIFAEGVVIVASILLALTADAWWDERQDRSEEREIIDRLISDLQANIDGIDQGLSILSVKEASLLRVDSVLRAQETPEDSRGFLKDVIDGANYGWNQYVPRRATFDELLGSGTFALISDAGLREAISDYHEVYRASQNRIDERETEYPQLTYELVPRSSGFGETVVLGLLDELSEDEAAEVVEGVFNSVPRQQVASEINLSRFIRSSFELQREAAVGLAATLEGYRARID